jgi:hypothetical protein
VQVGDLVTYAFQAARWRKGQSVDVGLVVETGKYTGNADVKVLWTAGQHTGQTLREKRDYLTLVDDYLTT